MMQPDLRADLALQRGEPVPADVVDDMRRDLHLIDCELHWQHEVLAQTEQKIAFLKMRRATIEARLGDLRGRP